MNILDDYYNQIDEDGRLTSRHGQVEYLTTMKYIHEYLQNDTNKQILEIGAGTGRYSITLAREGYSVTAVELIEHNIDVLTRKLTGEEDLAVWQGNALDLSFLEDSSYDLTLVLGPLYHLFTKEDKIQALSEAVRVTKPGGYLMVAYCMNEPTILQYVFGKNKLREVLDNHLITEDWHCVSEPKEIFDLIRTEEIEELNSMFDVEHIKLIATDGPSHYMRNVIDAMDQETFDQWMNYHFSTCERQDLIGASNHTLDILRKR
ncbi:MAG: class I SAM-dependent methyltransferase [Solobacterium sp.]|nr:class I SAM-dependent methyltransferase [Solobacterium sp.]